ncbi:MAG: ABC transporter ATP-binding protein/permease [candidate division Zixibacteria bacterium]|nr:ABC transporter ATP-binding protein/permease [candidate division Zixibacteria bacterium]MCI0594966.1 ABC transporter ATP-binding protein/permease [candidate division Zixibacteria bacterium]
MHGDDILGKAYDGALLRRLLRYLKPYREAVVLGVLLLLFSTFLTLSIPYLIKEAIDSGIARGDSDRLKDLMRWVVLVLVADFLVRYAQTYLVQWMGQQAVFDMRREVFAHLQKLSLSFYDKNPVGRLLTRVTSDVSVLGELFSSGVVAIFGDLFTLAGIVAYMLYLDVELSLATFTVLPLLIYATMVFRKKARESYRQVRLGIAKINAYLSEHIGGMTVVKLFAQKGRSQARFEGLSAELREAHLKSVLYHAVFFPVVEVIGAVSLALIIWYGGAEVLAGALTFGTIAAFVQYVDRFYQPIRDLAEKYNILQSAMASSERIFKLLDTPPEFDSPPGARPVENIRGEIRFENVWFAYRPGEWVLKDINLTIRPGEKVAIVGATGAGKTSLVGLLTRFYDYQKGKIYLDGVELKEMEIPSLRRAVGLVLQDVFLFSGDIAYNIRLGTEAISDEKLVEAARRVNLEPFVKGLPGGYRAAVEERGSTFSVGQKQLLSFARALAFDPKILILDEATSSVDTETELLIRDALEKLLAGRTSLVIAHRLSTVEKSDRIVVLHKGEIREAGTHAELLAKRGIYYRLYLLQYKNGPERKKSPAEEEPYKTPLSTER